jgi:hypothetical protein
MISPLLIIGVGGAGGKTIRAMKQELNRILESSGYTGGIPSAWQFLHIDTTRDGIDFPAPMLPADEFHCVVPSGARYEDILARITAHFPKNEQQSALAGWAIPAPTIPINTSPRQDRTIGRTVGVANSSNTLKAIRGSISKMEAPSAMAEMANIAKALGAQNPVNLPKVLIFSSLGGATGSGMFIDVAEVVKRSTSSGWGSEATTFLFAPDVFKSLGTASGNFAKNALGAMNELIVSQWIDLSGQTELQFSKMGLPFRVNSNRSGFGSSRSYLVDTNSIKALSGLIDLGGINADEMISSFAVGFVKTLISGEFEFYPDYPIDQFQPNNNLFVDKSGLMPETFANSFVDSLPAYRFHPFWSLTSLTEPILEEVARSKNQTQTWVQFWDGRRSRPLVEAVPFETEMRRSIVTGWFLAGFFGLRKIENLQVGRSLKIWNTTLEKPDWSTFPSPLLNSHPEDMKRESWLLPQLLMSAGIALANFGKTGNPEFINGYRLLKYLGREVTTSFNGRDQWDGNGLGDMLPSGERSRSSYLKNWVELGDLPSKSHSLNPLLYDSLLASPDRSEALITAIEKIRSQYTEVWANLSDTPWHSLPETWELREDIDSALSDISEYVRELHHPPYVPSL